MLNILRSEKKKSLDNKMECLTTALILSGLFSVVSGTLDLLWPLNNFTYTAEILQQPSNQNVTGCSITFGPDNLDVPLPTSFDGESSLDLPVESSFDGTGKDYSFAGWYWLIEPSGSLFHYKVNNGLSPFQEMKVIVVSQYIQATRVVNGVAESETSPSPVFTMNTWHYISFGIDISNGKIRVELDGTTIIDNDNNYGDNIDILLPGILRIGSTFGDVAPPLTGYVKCVSYHYEDRNPPSTDSDNLCATSQMSVSNPPVCDGKHLGQFVKFTSTNNLQELVSSTMCSVYQCALNCILMADCRYIQYDEMSTGCTTCYLLKFGVGTISPVNGFVYKYELN